MTTFYRLKEDGKILDYTSFEETATIPTFIKELYIETERKIIQLANGSFAFEDEVNLEQEAILKLEKEFNEAKQAKLNEVNTWTASKITGGFVCYCYNNEPILYDTDEKTQLTMTKARANCQSEKFQENFPKGMPCRGYKKFSKDENGKFVFDKADKLILLFSPEQIIAWDEDFSLFLSQCKGEGWVKQAEVEACTTKEEVEAIVLEENAEEY